MTLVAQHSKTPDKESRSLSGGCDSYLKRTEAMSTTEHCYQTMVELGGGKYQGVQQGFPELGLKPIVLFAGPSGSTLGLHPDNLSADAVRRAIAAKEAEFEEFEKSAVEQVWVG